MKKWLRKILGIERREQQKRIERMFSRYVDPEKVARLMKEKEAAENTGKNTESGSDGAKLSL